MKLSEKSWKLCRNPQHGHQVYPSLARHTVEDLTETVSSLELRCQDLESEIRALNIQANTLARMNQSAWKEVIRLRKILTDNGIKDKRRDT